MGVTQLDVVRSCTFLSAALKKKINDVPVVGGHAGTTILPLLSHLPGVEKLGEKTVAELTHRIQFGGDEVVKAKAGGGSATLSMAYAGAKFTNLVARAMKGEKGLRVGGQ